MLTPTCQIRLFSYPLNLKSLQCLKTVELVINRHYLIRKQINEVPHAELCSDDMEGLLEAGGIRS